MARLFESSFLERLRCLRCRRKGGDGAEEGRLSPLRQGGDRNDWLICDQCGYRYPIQDGFPVLIESKAVPPE